MNKAALFLALSLSIFSFGCGLENDGTSPSDNPDMPGKEDDPFANYAKEKMAPYNVYPFVPEGPLMMKASACKTDVYFYESKDGKTINWFGFQSKNDTTVHAFVYETKIMESVGYTILQPNAKAGGSDGAIERGRTITFYTKKLDSTGRYLHECETVHLTMPQ